MVQKALDNSTPQAMFGNHPVVRKYPGINTPGTAEDQRIRFLNLNDLTPAAMNPAPERTVNARKGNISQGIRLLATCLDIISRKAPSAMKATKQRTQGHSPLFLSLPMFVFSTGRNPSVNWHPFPVPHPPSLIKIARLVRAVYKVVQIGQYALNGTRQRLAWSCRRPVHRH